MVSMKRMIREMVFAWRYRRAVRKAKELAELFGMKYYVILLDGRLKVVPKRTVKELVRAHRFRKGVTVEDIERRALFVTV